MSDHPPHIEPTLRSTGSFAPDYFDKLYAQAADPWEFASSQYEAAKYAATLAALPLPHYRSALEIGCSIGVLSRSLAPRCARLLAMDVSDAALAQARERCVDRPSITFEHRDVLAQFPAGQFDLILLSEVGYYFAMPDLQTICRNIAAATLPGGHLILTHYTGVTNYPLSADAVHDTFLQSNATWWKISSHRTENYRMDVLERL